MVAFGCVKSRFFDLENRLNVFNVNEIRVSFRSPEKAGGGSIPSLATTSKQGVGKIRNVKLLGFKGKVKWTQDETGLKVEMRPEKPCDHTIALKIEGA